MQFKIKNSSIPEDCPPHPKAVKHTKVLEIPPSFWYPQKRYTTRIDWVIEINTLQELSDIISNTIELG